jgi:hypothetical protein
MNQNIVLAQNGATYSDYESIVPYMNWCTPSLLGFSICVNASASGGIITLQLTLKTPAGSYSKTFNIDSNKCFTWELPIPFGPSVKICISNLTTSPRVSFTLSLSLCIKIPIVGTKCATWTHDFVLPFMNETMLRSSNVSSEDLAALVVLLANDASDDQKTCNCH